MNRNAVLEQFGGMYCVYCPHGHLLADQIRQEHPGTALIYYHAGNYAIPQAGAPDLRTNDGDIISGATGLTGYPAGTVNRHVFPGLEQGQPGTTALGRGDWVEAVENILTLPAPVNIGAQAHIDVASRTLDLYLELYFTANSNSTNRLHIALLQNHILSPQAGGGQGDQYPQYNVFRDMLNGPWGEVLYNTTAGHFESRNYSFVLPESIRDVPLDLANTELVIFVTKDQQEVLNGLVAKPGFTVEQDDDVELLSVKTDPVICGGWVYPRALIRNDGNNPLGHVDIRFGLIGGPEQQLPVNLASPLATYEKAFVDLPPLPVPPGDGSNRKVWLSVDMPNGAPDYTPEDNVDTAAFSNAKATINDYLKIEVRTDEYGYELYWEIADDSGAIIASGGNEQIAGTGGGLQIAVPSDPGAYEPNSYYTRYVTLPAEGCYTLRLVDDFGDGICCEYGFGFVRVKDPDGKLVAYANKFSKSYEVPFEYTSVITASHEPVPAGFDWSIAPNPARIASGTRILVKNPGADPLTITLLDAGGSVILHRKEASLAGGNQYLNLPAEGLSPGLYLVKLETGRNVFFKKLLLLE